MSKAAGFHIGDIRGRDDVLKALNELKPNLYDELVDKMEAEAQSIAKAIDGAIPASPPLSGFIHNGRTSWGNRGGTSAIRSPTRMVDNPEWPVYKIMLGGYASAVTDIAGAGGAGDTLQGENMIAVLNGKVGKASRWVWPVAETRARAIEAKAHDACDRVAEKLSAQMGKGS